MYPPPKVHDGWIHRGEVFTPHPSTGVGLRLYCVQYDGRDLVRHGMLAAALEHPTSLRWALYTNTASMLYHPTPVCIIPVFTPSRSGNILVVAKVL